MACIFCTICATGQAGNVQGEDEERDEDDEGDEEEERVAGICARRKNPCKTSEKDVRRHGARLCTRVGNCLGKYSQCICTAV